jgi:exodeoxyribonuclease VII large subunit
MFDQISNAPTVSELLAHIKNTLEDNFNEVMVEGEISGISHAHSGHCYFNIMDQDASISCALFRQDLMRHPGFKNIKDGDKVLIYGPLTVYPKRGTFQILVKKIAPAGAGFLKMKFEALKKKLASEGYFDIERKKKIPLYPKKIALITAPGGAALHDFVNVYKRRGFNFQITIIPALVQGEKAPTSLMDALEKAKELSEIDVIVLTRGGGSPEDLWSFNDEKLIRKIAEMSVPVISAVGHEVDWTLCDYVSDLRCETPTAAAETLTQPQTELKEKIQSLNQRLTHFLMTKKSEINLRLTRYHPTHLMRSLKEQIESYRHRLNLLSIQDRSHQYIGLHEKAQMVDDLMREMENMIGKHNQMLRQRMEQAFGRLEAMNPKDVLKRGYAIISSQKNVVSSKTIFNNLSASAEFEIEFGDGKISGLRLEGSKNE